MQEDLVKDKKNNNMIEFENRLEGVKPEIISAIKEFWRNLSPHTIQVLAGKCNEEESKCVILQGGTLSEVNQARAALKMTNLDIKTNKKIAKPKFAEYLKKGDGALIVVRSNGFRHKNNNKIQPVIDWVSEKYPSITIEITENDRYDTFFFYIKKKKEKEEITDEPKTEETQINE